MLAFIPGVGMSELLIVLLIIMVLFGAKKIPDLMKGIGSGIKEFKKAAADIDESDSKKDGKNELSS